MSCATCTVNFGAEEERIESSNSFFHEKCFYEGNCKTCKQSIESGYVTALEGKFHKECFKCVDCEEKINSSMIDKNGLPQCQSCYEKEVAAEKAKKKHVHNDTCGHKVYDEKTCTECGDIILTGDEVTVSDDDKFYHNDCWYQHDCHVCKSRITEGKIITASEKKIHEACFKCHNCSEAFSSTGKKYQGLVDDQLVCTPCYKELTNFKEGEIIHDKDCKHAEKGSCTTHKH